MQAAATRLTRTGLFLLPWADHSAANFHEGIEFGSQDELLQRGYKFLGFLMNNSKFLLLKKDRPREAIPLLAIKEKLPQEILIAWRQTFSCFQNVSFFNTFTSLLDLTVKLTIGIMPAFDFVYSVFNQGFVKILQSAHFS